MPKSVFKLHSDWVPDFLDCTQSVEIAIQRSVAESWFARHYK